MSSSIYNVAIIGDGPTERQRHPHIVPKLTLIPKKQEEASGSPPTIGAVS